MQSANCNGSPLLVSLIRPDSPQWDHPWIRRNSPSRVRFDPGRRRANPL